MAIGLARRATVQDRQQSAVIRSVMAPTGGVNARDALAAMPANDAVILDNWFPSLSYVAVRNGSQTWATTLKTLERAKGDASLTGCWRRA